MMNNPHDLHPSSDQLTAFALGHLSDCEATPIADHLGSCTSCQQAVQSVPDDGLLSLLRPSSGTPLPQDQLSAGTVAFEDPVPPELCHHARYRVLRRLGAGGMGVVYQAEHQLMDRTVALKVINKKLIAAPGMVVRFQREVRAVARVSHPNLVQAFDADTAGDLHFLVLEFIDGVSLAALVKRYGPLPVDRACDYVRQAAVGLAHAAAQGLVHRDIKPHNIMVTPQGQVKVMDFGLANLGVEWGDEEGLTETGQGLGTPDYVAPEQIRDAHSADTRADIYSLGCTLYFLLAGRPPFPKGNSAQKMAAHLERQPDSLAELRPGLPAGLVPVIEKMMTKEPAQRYQTAAEVVAALEPFCRPPEATAPRRRRSKRWWAAVAGLLLAVAGLVSLAVVILHVDTEYGTLEITTDDADVQVLVKQNGKVVQIIDPKAKRTVELKTGPYELELTDNGHSLALSSNQFTLTREGKKIAVVKHMPKTKPGPATPKKVTDGKPKSAPDLSLLKPALACNFSDKKTHPFDPHRGQDGLWETFANQGYWVLVLHPSQAFKWRHAYQNDSASHDNFALQVTGRVKGHAHSGWAVYLLATPVERSLAVYLGSDGGVEVGVSPDPDKAFPVNLIQVPKHPHLKPSDQFNTVLVTRRDQILEVFVNGFALMEPITLTADVGPFRTGVAVWERKKGQGESRAEIKEFTLWELPAQ
jgi:hypothetical protein